MLPGGADPDIPCGDDCALHEQRPVLHKTPERSSGAPPSTAPLDPPPLRLCFVTADHGRVPGLWMEWVETERGRLARVVHPVLLEDGWDLREEWVPAEWVETPPTKS